MAFEMREDYGKVVVRVMGSHIILFKVLTAVYASIAAHVPDMRAAVTAAAEADGAPAAGAAPAAAPDPANPELHGLPEHWRPALRLMAGVGATVDDVRAIAARKGHFTPDTPADAYPQDYIDGCIVAQWPKWREEIERMRLDAEPVPFD